MTKMLWVVSFAILFGTAAAGASEDLCQKPKITVSVDSTDISKLSEANELMVSAKLCPDQKASSGCSIENIVPGSVLESMDLRNGDVVLKSNRAGVTDVMDLMRAFNDIGKGKVDCIVLKRQDKVLAIRYRRSH